MLCVKWNQNGNWVLTASKDQIIKVSNLAFFEPSIAKFKGFEFGFTSLLFLDVYVMFCSVLQLYDIRAMKELESFRGHRKDVTG